MSFLLALGSVVIARTLTRDGRSVGQRMVALAGPAAIVGACWLAGAYVVDTAEPLGQARRVAVVQTNVAPKLWTCSFTAGRTS